MKQLILILTSLFVLTSCELANIADDFVFQKPSDPQPIVLCTDTVTVTEPKFLTVYTEFFNGMSTIDTQYYFQVGNNSLAYPNLKALLIGRGYNADSIQVFTKGNSIAAIIKGTNDRTPIEGRIWTKDLVGQRAVLTVSVQAFLFQGALEFEEYKQVAIDFPSVKYFNFRNTNWTQAQYEEVAAIILGECKWGREDANFMFNALPISDSLYCQFRIMKWKVVRGQVFNCDPQPLQGSMLRARIYAQETRMSYGIPN
jgi:hypothetical protein